MTAPSSGLVTALAVLCVCGSILVVVLCRRRQQRLSADLERAVQHLELSSDVGDVLVWECRPDGTVTYAGGRLLEHFGYDPSDLELLTLRELIEPEDADRLSRFLAAGEGWHNERWRGVLKDGQHQWFLGSAEPIRTGGQLVGYRGSSRRISSTGTDPDRAQKFREQLRGVLDERRFVTAFQPILSVTTGRLQGAEALTRFPDSKLDPEAWFTGAAEVGMAVELDLAAITRALETATSLPTDIYLSLNISPAALRSTRLLPALLRSAIEPSRVVLEITEHASIVDYGEFLPVIAQLRDHGVTIAVDDAGAGYSSFRHILRLAPEYIKLDRSLVTGIDADPARRALAAAVVMFGLEMRSTIVAEGIETTWELRALQDLGIDCVQGYLLGRPTEDWTTWSEWHRRGPLFSTRAASRSIPMPRPDAPGPATVPRPR